MSQTLSTASVAARPAAQAASAGRLAAIVVFAAIVPAVLLMAPAVASQLAVQLRLGPVSIGNLFSAELGAMSLATLPAWYWLPRLDWRRAALGWAGLFVLANLLSVWADAYSSLFALRIVSALAGGSLMILCMSSAAASANPDRVYGLWVMGQLVLGAVGLAVLPRLFALYGIGACYAGLALLMALATPLARHLPAGAPDAETTAVRPDAGGGRGLAVLGIAAVLTFYLSLSGVWTFADGLARQAGLSAQASGDVLALATLFGVLGALLASLLGKRSWRRPALVLGYLAMLASIALWLGAPGLMRFAVAAFGFKFAWTFVLPFILASLAAIDSSGRLMSTTNLVLGGGLALGPMLAGHILASGPAGFQALLTLALAVGGVSLGLILAAQGRRSV